VFLGRSIFKMYVKTGCPFCEKAREIILKDLKCSLHLVDVTNQPDLREMIINNTGQKTVPAIYIGEEFVGGSDKLTFSHSSLSFNSLYQQGFIADTSGLCGLGMNLKSSDPAPS